MYIFKKQFKYLFKLRQCKAAKQIGLENATMSNILNQKVACRKVVAYCITKYLDKDAEIEDYFERVEKKGE